MGSLDEERLLSAPASSGEALELGAAQHTWRTGFWGKLFCKLMGELCYACIAKAKLRLRGSA